MGSRSVRPRRPEGDHRRDPAAGGHALFAEDGDGAGHPHQPLVHPVAHDDRPAPGDALLEAGLPGRPAGGVAWGFR